MVYRATAASRVAGDAWRLVDSRLPRPILWFEWDRCQRLRAALAGLFVRRDLSPLSFGQVTTDDDLFVALADAAAKTGRGRRFLWHVRQALKDSDRQRHAWRIRAIGTLVD